MKLKGFLFRQTDLARHISPTPAEAGAVWVPQDRTTSFRKLACADPAQMPREVEFEVEDWLAAKPEFAAFQTVKAEVKPDHRRANLENKLNFHVKHCDQCAGPVKCPIGQYFVEQLSALCPPANH